MAMGGIMKGHTLQSSNGNRKRPYGLMLILAFGAAIFGVMVLHKLRERRIFNLLVIEKDRQIISLQLLLQGITRLANKKERDDTKGAERKIEEMKAKIYKLQTLKMELNSRILEMQSTISSLKDEQRMIGSALEEKQHEIKLLREREIDLHKENPQVIALSETWRRKETEMDSELPVKVWSVSSDDPSNPPANLTNTASITQREETEVNESEKHTSEGLHGSTNYYKDEKNSRGSSTQSEEKRENEVGIANGRERIREEQFQKVGDSKEDDGHEGTAGEKSTVEDHVKNLKDFQAIDVEKFRSTRDAQPGKLSSSLGGDNQDLRVAYKGGMKLEMPNNSQGGDYRLRGNRDHVRKTKGKRPKIIARNRVFRNKGNPEDSGVASMNGRRFFTDALKSERNKRLDDDSKEDKLQRQEHHDVNLKIRDEFGQEDGKSITSDKPQQGEGLKFNQVGLRNGEAGAGLNREKGENDQQISEDSPQEVTRAAVSDEVKLLTNKYERTEKLHSSPDQVLTETDSETSETFPVDNKQKPGEAKQSKEQDTVIKQQIERRDTDKVDGASEQAIIADKDEEPDDPDVMDVHDVESDVDNSIDSPSELEEDREDYKEQTYEPEF
ncbi:unnamed protein product [Ilex paraguariensis]|uniref:Micronuclear linker histone polyprotein-like protein n=1 Tax=Ilex paraguariensis TaxID=185542 RepID=A0ABC8SSN1_9AQUA